MRYLRTNTKNLAIQIPPQIYSQRSLTCLEKLVFGFALFWETIRENVGDPLNVSDVSLALAISEADAIGALESLEKKHQLIEKQSDGRYLFDADLFSTEDPESEWVMPEQRQ